MDIFSTSCDKQITNKQTQKHRSPIFNRATKKKLKKESRQKTEKKEEKISKISNVPILSNIQESVFFSQKLPKMAKICKTGIFFEK